MGSLTDELRPESPVGVLSLALVSIVALGVVVMVAAVSPEVLVAVATLGFLAWGLDAAGALGDDSGAEPETDEDALAQLRRRYAAGEMTESEFERRLDRLLETETLEDAKRRRERERAKTRGREGEGEPNRESKRKRERER